MDKKPACSRCSRANSANSGTKVKGTKTFTARKSILEKTTETEVEHNIEKSPSGSRGGTATLKASMAESNMSEEKRQTTSQKAFPAESTTETAVGHKITKKSSSPRGSKANQITSTGESNMSEEKRQSIVQKGTPLVSLSPTGTATEQNIEEPASSQGSTASLKTDSRRESENKQHSGSLRVIPANITTETAVDQFELERARLAKKREMKTIEYGRYTRGFYGSPCEKEEVRKEQREALLHQIQRKDENAKDLLQKKVKESETAVAYDQACKDADRQDYIKKANYLKQFRDGNKQLIEEREQERRRQRDEERRLERELWKQNPFNWSQTLT